MSTSEAEKAGYLEEYRKFSDQYKEHWENKSPPRVLSQALLNRIRMTLKLEQHSIAFYDLSTTFMGLLNSSSLLVDDPDDQEMLLNFWFLLTSAAFGCGLYPNAKEMAERAEPLAQDRPEMLAQILQMKKKSIENISECYGACRSHMRIPWDDLASNENLHSPECVARLNETALKLSDGTFTVQLGRYGRELRAARYIKKGESFSLAPHLSSTFNIDTSTICYHCSEFIPKADRGTHCCPDCGAIFCSSRCLDEAIGRYHVPLCGIPVMEFFDWYFSQCTEISSLMILTILKVFAEAKFKGITPVEVDCVRDLCVHNSPVEYIDPVGMQVFAGILQLLNIENGDPNYEFWHYIAVHQRIGANCFGNGEIATGAGSALAGYLSNANHDCLRNNVKVAERIEVTKDIKKGEEVLNFYIPKSVRGIERESLLLGYNIRCECRICGPNTINV